MWWVSRRANIFSATVRPKARKAAAACVTIALHWIARKEYKPENSAVDLANSMGIELLNESEYRELQKLGTFRHQNIELGKNS